MFFGILKNSHKIKSVGTLYDKDLFIFDVEGVIFPSIDEPEAPRYVIEVISKLREKGKKIAFMTNISRTSWRKVANLLIRSGVAKSPEEVFTAGKVTIEYVKGKRRKPRVFVISEKGLLTDFENEEEVELRFSKPVDFVVVGMKRNMDFDEVNFALECVLDGAELISVGQTNYYRGEFFGKEGVFIGDVPVCSMLAFASGKKFTRIGKPYPLIYRMVLKKFKVRAKNTVMIGDKLETDIKGANKLGITSVLVDALSSHRHFTPQKIKKEREKINPTFKIKNLKELLNFL